MLEKLPKEYENLWHEFDWRARRHLQICIRVHEWALHYGVDDHYLDEPLSKFGEAGNICSRMRSWLAKIWNDDEGAVAEFTRYGIDENQDRFKKYEVEFYKRLTEGMDELKMTDKEKLFLIHFRKFLFLRDRLIKARYVLGVLDRFEPKASEKDRAEVSERFRKAREAIARETSVLETIVNGNKEVLENEDWEFNADGLTDNKDVLTAVESTDMDDIEDAYDTYGDKIDDILNPAYKILGVTRSGRENSY